MLLSPPQPGEPAWRNVDAGRSRAPIAIDIRAEAWRMTSRLPLGRGSGQWARDAFSG